MFSPLICLLASLLSVVGESQGLSDIRSSTSSPTRLPSYNLPLEIAYNLGAYSARYEVDRFGDYGPIERALPSGCSVTQVNVLQRHGARFPTKGQAMSLNATLATVHQAVAQHPDAIEHTPLAFLSHWSFPFGVNDLVPFGREQAYVSGVQTARKYASLVEESRIFERATTKPRILEGSRWFRHGFDGGVYPFSESNLELPDVIIPIGPGYNNTLSCSLCSSSISDDDAPLDPYPDPGLKSRAPANQWLATYAPAIASRLESYVPGLNLTNKDVLSLMSVCGFETAYLGGQQTSPWCNVFTTEEWAANEYWYDLDKYWSKGYGAPLGRANGSGWVNELVARLTGQSVHASGCVNSTLDANQTTFPLPPSAPSMFVDFSSDNNMAGIISALGILHDVEPLPGLGPPPTKQLWVASKLVPFAANLVVEKLSCAGGPGNKETVLKISSETDFVRIVLNDAVVPMTFDGCGDVGVSLGLCGLDAFVKAQAFSMGGGGWDGVCGSPSELP